MANNLRYITKENTWIANKYIKIIQHMLTEKAFYKNIHSNFIYKNGNCPSKE